MKRGPLRQGELGMFLRDVPKTDICKTGWKEDADVSDALKNERRLETISADSVTTIH